MNALIALCHFCELHGPSILFCTKPYHCILHTTEDVLNGAPASPSACGISKGRFSRSSTLNDIGSQVVEGKLPQAQTRQSTCEACRSVQSGDPGILSIDRESHISYISMQYPEEQRLYSMLRHACLRSLSCEVTKGREGPMMFGDETDGYVVSYPFFMKDIQSRGFQRWYSLICVMMDRIYLLNSCPFVVREFRRIIDDLQAKAEKVYRGEQAEQPHRATRLQMSSKSVLSKDQFLRSRGGQLYRSLPDITRDKSIFQHLHISFSWILKVSVRRYSEKLLEGPPVDYYLHDPEEEGSTLATSFQGLYLEGQKFAELKGPAYDSLMSLYQAFGDEQFFTVAFHVVRGDQVIVQSKWDRTVISTLLILKNLIPSGCFRCLPYETDYRDSWRCNFLGLAENVTIPAHFLLSDLYVLIKIDSSRDEANPLNSTVVNDPSTSELSLTVSGSNVDKESTYLRGVMQALRSQHESALFEATLTALKEQWMSKVRVMFKFSKSGIRTTEDKLKLMQILGAKPEDEILLKFWMISLSKGYRLHLLSSGRFGREETTYLKRLATCGFCT